MGTKNKLENVAEIDYWNRYANEVLGGIDGLEGLMHARLRSQIIYALKEVERDTRHRCAEMASALHGEILNSRPV